MHKLRASFVHQETILRCRKLHYVLDSCIKISALCNYARAAIFEPSYIRPIREEGSHHSKVQRRNEGVEERTAEANQSRNNAERSETVQVPLITQHKQVNVNLSVRPDETMSVCFEKAPTNCGQI